MNKAEKWKISGRTLLLTVIAVRLAENLLFDFFYVSRMPLSGAAFSGASVGIVVGALIHAILFYHLYKGAKWGLIGVLAFGAVSLAFALINFSMFNLIDILLIITCMTILLFNKNVKSFLKDQFK
ncbi:hypothetical protein [Paenibacillus sp. NPDC058174]|uniref:hypothetical protein n=1 Tax=Paenibacillus sp. NPDC058174 TaxID=3346366 RepID=UPI0036D96C2F